MSRLDGKVALITGGARGQGAAEARLFASEGASVVLADVLDDEGAEVAAAIGGGYQHLDVTDEAAWRSVVAAIVDRHGGLDVLVNNAGIFVPGQLLQTPVDQYRRVIEVNQTGVFLGMQISAPAMIDSGGGSIVNISSVAGLRGGTGSIAYGASKWAVRGMTKYAAKEFASRGVRVNSIHPGIIDYCDDAPASRGRTRATSIRSSRGFPQGRVGEPEDVAMLALFLASDESAYCTGAEFVVDGGMTS